MFYVKISKNSIKSESGSSFLRRHQRKKIDVLNQVDADIFRQNLPELRLDLSFFGIV